MLRSGRPYALSYVPGEGDCVGGELRLYTDNDNAEQSGS